MQFFFLQHKFSIAVRISLQWPHLHQIGEGGTGGLGLSGVGGLSGNDILAGGERWVGGLA